MLLLRRHLVLGPCAGLLSAVLAGCFDASGTLGAACERDDDCATDQSCRSGTCGRCGDGTADPGELCFGPTNQAAIGGAPVALALLDPDRDGRVAPFAAVNTECSRQGPGGLLPPVACWKIVALSLTDAGLVAQVPSDEDAVDGTVSALAFGEFDRDPELDVVAGAGTLVVVANSALSGGREPQLVNVGDAPVGSLATLDVDGDGLDEIAVGFTEARGVVLLRSASAEVAEFAVWATLPEDPDPTEHLNALLVDGRDIDGDGDEDLVAVNAVSGSLAVYWNQGAASGAPPEFTLQLWRLPTPAGTVERAFPVSAVIEDLTGDGRLDVAAVDAAYARVALVEGTGRAELATDAASFLQVAASDQVPTFILAEDFTGDGRPDLAVSISGADDVVLLPARDGGFLDLVPVDVGLAPFLLVAGDLNDDGRPDLVVGQGTGAAAVRVSDP
jgi:hypothetical protein